MSADRPIPVLSYLRNLTSPVASPLPDPELLGQFIARRDRWEKLTLLDVREEWELKVASVPGIVHIPMNDVPKRIAELENQTSVHESSFGPAARKGR